MEANVKLPELIVRSVNEAEDVVKSAPAIVSVETPDKVPLTLIVIAGILIVAGSDKVLPDAMFKIPFEVLFVKLFATVSVCPLAKFRYPLFFTVTKSNV